MHLRHFRSIALNIANRIRDQYNYRTCTGMCEFLRIIAKIYTGGCNKWLLINFSIGFTCPSDTCDNYRNGHVNGTVSYRNKLQRVTLLPKQNLAPDKHQVTFNGNIACVNLEKLIIFFHSKIFFFCFQYC